MRFIAYLSVSITPDGSGLLLLGGEVGTVVGAVVVLPVLPVAVTDCHVLSDDMTVS